MVGHRAPDVGSIVPGVTRADAERMLGVRLCRLGVADAVTYDVYQFDASRPANPAAGAAVMLADLFTLGLMETTPRAHRRAWPVRQVAIGYDDTNRIRFVSKAWAGTSTDCGCMRSRFPSDTGIPATAIPAPLAGAATLDATFAWDSAFTVIVDGHSVAGNPTRLSAGTHEIEFRSSLRGSFMYGASGNGYAIYADVTLQAGRAYRLEHEPYSVASGTRDVFWIRDTESNEVLHCTGG